MSKKIHIHFVAKTYHPAPGGLAKSGKRIISSLSGIEDFTAHVYVIGVKDFPILENNILSTYDLKEFLTSPFGDYLDVPLVERNRVDYLILKNSIESEINKFPSDPHVIISFFISTTGYVCQIVADVLGIPHIVSVRGSDFSRDLHCPSSLSAIDWIINRVDYIVTTNNDQLTTINNFFSRNHNVTTIPNAIEDSFLNKKWEFHQKNYIKLIADSGFSFNKATHVLLDSVEKLIIKGFNLELNLIGDIEASQESNRAYWNHINKSYQEKYPNNFIFHQKLSSEKLLEFLINSDFYLSATFDEGCSNGRIQALSIGIPMVSTRTGELIDVVAKLGDQDHIYLCTPGDPKSFVDCLETALIQYQKRALKPNPNFLENVRTLFSSPNERKAWEQVIRAVV